MSQNIAPNGQPYSDKSKLVAGLLQIFLGGLGIGRFYTGHTGMAIAQLLTCGGLGVWALIDGILFLVKDDRTDKAGRVLRA
ncbi:TM2 domain-containing protein [Streptomyces sp. NPDC099050]|uniref:TM2 domain-containing protein n=1 Tax=unclassified Streptomyces TaxID=2593676 RepID=UPI002E13CF6C|nr:TM2 domain-containing protein [Streptomyces sp. NBC_01298]